MATPNPPEDRALAALAAMMKEFQTHKLRLAARAKSVAEALTSGQIADVPALGNVVVELFQELHDTTLSFQEETVQLILDEWSKDDDEDDDEELDEDEEPIDADEPVKGDAGDESQLAAGDAAQLRRTTTEYKAMLDAMLASDAPDPEQRQAMELKRTDASASLELIDDIEITDDEPLPGADAPS